MASEVKKFLEPDLEKIFLEDIRRNDHRLRGENYLWYYCHRARGFESGIFFWDDDIYQKARRMGYSGPTDGKPIISYFAQL